MALVYLLYDVLVFNCTLYVKGFSYFDPFFFFLAEKRGEIPVDLASFLSHRYEGVLHTKPQTKFAFRAIYPLKKSKMFSKEMKWRNKTRNGLEFYQKRAKIDIKWNEKKVKH